MTSHICVAMRKNGIKPWTETKKVKTRMWPLTIECTIVDQASKTAGVKCSWKTLEFILKLLCQWNLFFKYR